MADERRMFIDGDWVEARDGDRFDTIDPATGAVLASVPSGTEADVDRAVAAARRVFDEGPWGMRTPERERARVLLRTAELVRAERDRLAELEVRDCGKPLAEARADIDEVAFLFEYYGGWATKISGDVPPVGPDALSLVVKEPVGVCGLIVPWNYPMLMASQKVAPALAAGCSVVLKPAEQTPLTALELARLLAEAGLPAGACNVVTGFGPAAGAPLVAHPAVDKISFTGSREVGKIVMREASEGLKRVTLELGGKSPNIVFADADFDAAIAGTCAGIFANQGEVCSAGSRVFVERPVFERALEAMALQVADIRLGSGLHPDTTMGPLVSKEQQDRVESYLAIGREEGATLAAEGRRPDDPTLAGGFFVPPAIFVDVDHSMRIAREEIFGPVMALLAFDDVDQVVGLANDTEYGLAAAIWTRDLAKALRTARAVRAGVVWINDSQPAPSEAMWGGFKQSGIGRELGPYALDAYLETKQIYVNLAG
ncbi:MAG: aldehyde dehydrogenase family protein [Acidimicrobiales bacterium]|nr:aldehyde dehydrogenase family protein [Acidimicrobiales bacterium]